MGNCHPVLKFNRKRSVSSCPESPKTGLTNKGVDLDDANNGESPQIDSNETPSPSPENGTVAPYMIVPACVPSSSGDGVSSVNNTPGTIASLPPRIGGINVTNKPLATITPFRKQCTSLPRETQIYTVPEEVNSNYQHPVDNRVYDEVPRDDQTLSKITAPPVPSSSAVLPGGRPLFENVPASQPDLTKRPSRGVLKVTVDASIVNPSVVPAYGSSDDDEEKNSDVEIAADQSELSIAAVPSIKILQIPADTIVESDSDDDEEDEEIPTGGLGSKVQRNASLARFLEKKNASGVVTENPDTHEPTSDNSNDQMLPLAPPLPLISTDRAKERNKIEVKLERKLSERPTAQELRDKYILQDSSAAERRRQMEETKRFLIRKLSYRPTVEELRDRSIIRFNDYIEVTEAECYDRTNDKPWTRLTSQTKASIRDELNRFKANEMPIHDESKHMIRYHNP